MEQQLVCTSRPFQMTLPAHCRPALLRRVTPFTVGVKGLHQGRLPVRRLYFMAIRAALIFGGFIFQQAAVFIIDMVADIAVFDFGEFIVIVMPEHRRRAPWVFKSVVVHKRHVFLGVSTNQYRQGKQRYRQDKESLFFHCDATLKRLSKNIPLGAFLKIKLAIYAIANQIAS